MSSPKIGQTVLLSAVVLGALGGAAERARAGGEISFEPLREFFAGDFPFAITGGDFDGDGHIDIVLSHQSLQPWAVMFGDGEGNFGPPTTFPSISGARLAAVDIDADGDLDVLGSRGLTGVLIVAENDGTGDFTVTQVVPLGGLGGTGVATGDFDADGDEDCAVISEDGFVTVLVNDGRGGFRPVQRVRATTGSAFNPVGNLVAADMNADGHPDLVGGSEEYPQLFVLRATAGRCGPLQAPVPFCFRRGPIDIQPPIPQGARNVDVGDLDGDGDQDVFAVSGDLPVPFWMQVALNDGVGTLTLGWGGAPLNVAAVNVKLADMDLDGDLDAVILDHSVEGFNLDGINVLVNDGAANFASPVLGWPSSVEQAPSPVDLLVADLDGDGDLDVVIPNKGTDTVGVLLNNTP